MSDLTPSTRPVALKLSYFLEDLADDLVKARRWAASEHRGEDFDALLARFQSAPLPAAPPGPTRPAAPVLATSRPASLSLVARGSEDGKTRLHEASHAVSSVS